MQPSEASPSEKTKPTACARGLSSPQTLDSSGETNPLPWINRHNGGGAVRRKGGEIRSRPSRRLRVFSADLCQSGAFRIWPTTLLNVRFRQRRQPVRLQAEPQDGPALGPPDRVLLQVRHQPAMFSTENQPQGSIC